MQMTKTANARMSCIKQIRIKLSQMASATHSHEKDPNVQIRHYTVVLFYIGHNMIKYFVRFGTNNIKIICCLFEDFNIFFFRYHSSVFLFR